MEPSGQDIRNATRVDAINGRKDMLRLACTATRPDLDSLFHSETA
jgi:hypothetical protein